MGAGWQHQKLEERNLKDYSLTNNNAKKAKAKTHCTRGNSMYFFNVFLAKIR